MIPTLRLKFQMGFDKRGWNPNRKEEKPKWGGHTGTGRPKKIKNDEGEEVGRHGLNPEERRVHEAQRQQDWRAQASEGPARKKTKEEEEEEQRDGRGLRLAGRVWAGFVRLANRRTKASSKAAAPVEAEEETRDETEAESETEDEGDEDEEEEDTAEEAEEAAEEVVGGEGDPDSDEDQPLEEENVTLEENMPGAEQQSLGEMESLINEVANLLSTYKKRASEGKNKQMRQLLTKIYDRTRHGGQQYEFGVYYHPDMELHRDPDPTKEWDECPERTQAIMKMLEEEGLLENAVMLTERRLLKKEEAKCHTETLWMFNEKLESMTNKQLCKWTEKNWETMTLFANTMTIEAAKIAAGGVLVALDYIFEGGKFRGLLYCVVRPPGHHCTACQPGGFCLFNNASIGASYAVIP